MGEIKYNNFIVMSHLCCVYLADNTTSSYKSCLRTYKKMILLAFVCCEIISKFKDILKAFRYKYVLIGNKFINSPDHHRPVVWKKYCLKNY